MQQSQNSYDFDSLFQINHDQLSKVLMDMIRKQDFYEQKNSELVQLIAQLHKEKESLQGQIANLEVRAAQFQQGMEQIQKINSKLQVHSERFQVQEERHIQVVKQLNDWQIKSDRHFDKNDRSIVSIQEELCKISVHEIFEKIKAEKDFINSFSQQLEQKQKEFQFESELRFDRQERRLQEFLAQLQEEEQEIQESLNQEESVNIDNLVMIQPKSRNEGMKLLTKRIISLENTLNDLVKNFESGQAWNSIQKSKENIRDPNYQEDVILEIQHKYAHLVNEVKQLQILVEDNQNLSESLGKFPAFEKYIPLSKHLKKIEKMHLELENWSELEGQVRKLDEKVQNLQKFNQEEEELPQERKQAFLQALGSKLISQQNINQETDETAQSFIQQIVETSNQQQLQKRKIKRSQTLKPNLQAEHTELLNKISQCPTKQEVNQIIERNKQYLTNLIQRDNSDLQDKIDKITEFEQRLNGLWRNTKEISENIETNKKNGYERYMNLKQEMDYNLVNIEEKNVELKQIINKKSKEINQRIDKMGKKLSEFENQLNDPSQNEQYFRSLISQQRNEILAIQQKLRKIETSNSNSNIFEFNMNSIEEINDNIESSKLKSILQQHDHAIRFLGNKLIQGDIQTGVSHDIIQTTENLNELKNLKQEMKEMMNKQETNRLLTNKDIDIINTINQALDQKISRNELLSKVDKPELKRIYQALKKRIDDIQSTLSNPQGLTNSARDDAFFLKKRYDLECASCGQYLSENTDLQNTNYKPWGKFPRRSPVLPGYSRIISSLVASSSGSLALPKRELNDQLRSANMSPVYSMTTTPGPRVNKKKRLNAKLPSVKS